MGHCKFLRGSNISAYTWISSRNYWGSGMGVGWKTAEEDSSSGTKIFQCRSFRRRVDGGERLHGVWHGYSVEGRAENGEG